MQFWSGTAFLETSDVLAVTRMLDETGFDGMICADHLIYPRKLISPYPSPAGVPPWRPETGWPDSWVLIGAMAAITNRLRFTNAVYVAPARPLLEVAKRVATAAEISEGRVALAVGDGWVGTAYVWRTPCHISSGRRRCGASTDALASRSTSWLHCWTRRRRICTGGPRTWASPR